MGINYNILQYQAVTEKAWVRVSIVLIVKSLTL